MRKTVLLSELAGLIGTVQAMDIETRLENGETVVTVVLEEGVDVMMLKEEFDIPYIPEIPEFRYRETVFIEPLVRTHPVNAARKR